MQAETQRHYSSEYRKIKKRELEREYFACHKMKITKTNARALNNTVGTKDNAQAVGKATRGKYGYAEDGRVKKGRQVH